MQKSHDPVELLILAAVLVASALLTLATALVALVATVWSYRPAATPMRRRAICPPALVDKAPADSPVGGEPENVPLARVSVAGLRHTPPAVHPLLETLEGLTVAQLRPLAGVRSKRHRRGELIDLAGVAMAC
jgi:hypothetical protein